MIHAQFVKKTEALLQQYETMSSDTYTHLCMTAKNKLLPIPDTVSDKFVASINAALSGRDEKSLYQNLTSEIAKEKNPRLAEVYHARAHVQSDQKNNLHDCVMAICTQPENLDFYQQPVVWEKEKYKSIYKATWRRYHAVYNILPVLYTDSKATEKAFEDSYCGLMHLAKKEYDEALKCFNNAHESMPNNVLTSLMCAVANYYKNDYVSALDYCSQAIHASHESNIPALFLRAKIHEQLNEFDYARFYFSKINDLKTAVGYQRLSTKQLAAINQRLQGTSKSTEIKQAQVSESKQLLDKGKACIAVADYEPAIEMCNQALDKDDQNILALYYRCMANFKMGNYKSAWIDCENFCKFKSDYHIPEHIYTAATKLNQLLIQRLCKSETVFDEGAKLAKVLNDKKLSEVVKNGITSFSYKSTHPSDKPKLELSIKTPPSPAKENASDSNEKATEKQNQQRTLELAARERKAAQQAFENQARASSRKERASARLENQLSSAAVIASVLKAEEVVVASADVDNKSAAAVVPALTANEKLANKRKTKKEKLRLKQAENVSTVSLAAESIVAAKTEGATPNDVKFTLPSVVRKIHLPAAGKEFLTKLTDRQLTATNEKPVAFVFGGYVRDTVAASDSKDPALESLAMQGKAANDFDIVTNLSPAEIKAQFPQTDFLESINKSLICFVDNLQIQINCRPEIGKSMLLHAKTCDISTNKGYADADGNMFLPCVSDLTTYDPKIVYIEPEDLNKDIDPKKLLNAVRQSVKPGYRLGFKTENFIKDNLNLFDKFLGNPGELNHKMRKMFEYGNALANFNKLVELGVLQKLFPEMAKTLDRDIAWLRSVMKTADTRYAAYHKAMQNDTGGTFPKPSLTHIYTAFIISAVTPIEAGDTQYFNRTRNKNVYFDHTFSMLTKASVSKKESEAPVRYVPHVSGLIRSLLLNKKMYEKIYGGATLTATQAAFFAADVKSNIPVASPAPVQVAGAAAAAVGTTSNVRAGQRTY